MEKQKRKITSPDESSYFTNSHSITYTSIGFANTEKYKCELFGLEGAIIVYKNKRPNWFWRKMQYWCFGNVWKINKE